MTQKNLKPQQAAPVQREINNTTPSESGTGLVPGTATRGIFLGTPFAGDDAE